MAEFTLRTVNLLDAGSERPRHQPLKENLVKLPDEMLRHPDRLARLAAHEARVAADLAELELRSESIRLENGRSERAMAHMPRCRCGAHLRYRGRGAGRVRRDMCGRCEVDARRINGNDGARANLGVAGGVAGGAGGEGE